MTTPSPGAQPDALQAPTPPALDKRDWIAGLEKGLGIIECFDDANPRLTASQAGVRCGMTRTAARRYLLTLEHLGYVASDGKLFWLTPRVLRLGQSYLESARLPRIVQPFLARDRRHPGERVRQRDGRRRHRLHRPQRLQPRNEHRLRARLPRTGRSPPRVC